MTEQAFGGRPPAPGRSGESAWGKRLRAHVVTRGIEFVCGTSASVSAGAATDVPLVTAALRMAWLRGLGACGVRKITTTSGLGHKFICHIGDIAEYPYYHRRAFEKELALCAAWLDGIEKPVIFDLGANVGFFATQLAQMLAAQEPRIVAFEPVPTTFAKLVQSVESLGLDKRVQPIQAAVIDKPGHVHVNYSQRNSLYAQVGLSGAPPHPRIGNESARAAAISLDHFCALQGRIPALIKMDVEGSEVAALRGAREMLKGADRPALLFEYNPVTLAECGATVAAFEQLLAGYTLHYVDDLDGQLVPFGNPVARLSDIDWQCNLFAVPAVAGTLDRWGRALSQATSQIKIKD
jgi:FkbM family methyltransferase